MNLEIDTETPINRDKHWRGIDVLAITLIIIMVLLIGVVGYGYLIKIGFLPNPADDGLTIWISISFAALEAIILLGSVYILGKRRDRGVWSAAGFRAAPMEWLIKAVVISTLIIPLSGLIALFIQWITGAPMQNPQIAFIAPDGFSWFGLVSMVLLGGLLIPFAEELYFRGVLYVWLSDRWGTWMGIIVSSLIFGIVHGELSVGVAAFFMGLVLAWVFERSESIWPGVMIHAINNSVKIILLYLLLALEILPN